MTAISIDAPANAAVAACRVCGNDRANTRHRAREMMLGLGDVFEYLECSDCGSLQICEPPPDLSRYYPSGYYSYAQTPAPSARWSLRALVRRRRDFHAVFGGGMGRLLLRRFPEPNLASLARTGLTLRSRVLDVGCGAGVLLASLAGLGFRSLLGIDPFLQARDDGGRAERTPYRIEKCDIAEVDGSFDLVMFHHSFEHLASPEDTLRHVARLLAPGGTCLIRMPTPSSFAWREYRTDWVQLDAPRHLCLLSVRGTELLAQRVGFELLEIRDDSTGFQFWGSEQYRRGIPLESECSYAKNPSASPFSKREIREFEARARGLNRRRDGDQIAVYLRRGAGAPQGVTDAAAG